MIIVADSGSTKTEWIILKDGEIVKKYLTSGFNPKYFAPEILSGIIREELIFQLEGKSIRSVYFYGSGCYGEKPVEIVGKILRDFFPSSTIEIHHDLFGAARALFYEEKGIACILGTGASSCCFDGENVTAQVPSLGFLLADEGSGVHLGKKLLNAWFKNDLPENLHRKFQKKYSLELNNFLTGLYKEKKPNSKIASFVPFIVENITEIFLQNIVRESFREFFIDNILRYPDYQKLQVGFVGSVACLFSKQIKEVAESFGVNITKILRSPADGLVNFHKKY